MTAGVISDTHGLMRREALDALRDADLIIHAGDIGKSSVLEILETIAPVFAVRGNIDREEWASSLPASRLVEVESVRIYVVHDIKDLDIDPVAESIQMVISGHSHLPAIVERNGVSFLNPGSAGPRRFSLPISMAVIRISGRRIQVRLVDLQSSSHRPG